MLHVRAVKISVGPFRNDAARRQNLSNQSVSHAPRIFPLYLHPPSKRAIAAFADKRLSIEFRCTKSRRKCLKFNRYIDSSVDRYRSIDRLMFRTYTLSVSFYSVELGKTNFARHAIE